MKILNFTSEDLCTTNISIMHMEHAATRYLRHTIANIIGSFTTVILALIAIFGNTAVVIATSWSESLRVQTGNYLIVYLSLIDILTGLLVIIPSAVAVASDDWILGTVSCKIHASMQYTFACSSTYTLAAISIDRAIAVLYPLEYKMCITLKVIVNICCLIFLISFTVGLVCGAPDWSSYDYYEAVCAIDYSTGGGVVYVITAGFCTCYLVPSLIICVCNTLVIRTARKSGKSLQSLFLRRDNVIVNMNVRDKAHGVQMRKTVKSMIVVIIAFYICYTPYAVSKKLKVILGTDMPPWFNYMTTIFIFAGSAVNPFIYAILRKDYRNAFKKLPKFLKEMF